MEQSIPLNSIERIFPILSEEAVFYMYSNGFIIPLDKPFSYKGKNRILKSVVDLTHMRFRGKHLLDLRESMV